MRVSRGFEDEGEGEHQGKGEHKVKVRVMGKGEVEYEGGNVVVNCNFVLGHRMSRGDLAAHQTSGSG